jgi:twitching motility protein PilT
MIIDTIVDLVNQKVVFTDLYIRQDEPLKIRTPSGWISCSDTPITEAQMKEFIEGVVGADFQQRIQANGGAIDVAKSINGVARLRCNIFYCGDSEAQYTAYGASIRKLSVSPPSIQDIGIPETMIPIIMRSKGLWLITGPTGNGKSTTIASMMEYVNQRDQKHILTIEQPIEYVITPKKCIVTQREVGSHTASFSAGLYAALRQRPDIIMLGEVRDRETLETMLGAAESGHLVLSTMHSKNVEDTLNKIAGYFTENKTQKLMSMAMNIGGIISQSLVPSLDKKSLVLAYEIYVNNPEGQQCIRKDELQKIRNAIQNGKANGSCLMNDTLMNLLRLKKISVETAREVAYDKESIRGMF